MRDNRDDAPLRDSELNKMYTQLMRYLTTEFDEVKSRLENIENDVNTIAKNTGHVRDKTGQLKKTA